MSTPTPPPTTPYDPRGGRMGGNKVSNNPVVQRQAVAQQRNQASADVYNQKIEDIQARMDIQSKALQAYMADNKPGKPLDFLPDWAQTPLEKTFSGLYWTYSKFVSQPITFAVLAQRQLRAYALDDDVWHAGSDETLSVRELWNNSRNFSPAQAITISNMSAELLDKEKLNVTDPLKGKFTNEQFFNKGPIKYFTGTLDAAISWYTDPLVLLSKVAQVARASKQVRPVTRELEKFKDPTTGKVDFERMLTTQDSVLSNMVSFVEKSKAKYGDDPRALLRMGTLKNSPRGMDLASALVTARTTDEIADVLRVSMGDIERVGVMRTRNAALANSMYSLSRTITATNMSLSAAANPVARAAYTQAVNNQTSLLQAMERQSGFITKAVGADDAAFGAMGSLTNLNFNAITSPAMLSFRNAMANAPRFRGDGQPSNFFSKVIYSGLYSTPLRILRLPGDIRPPRFIDLNSQDGWRGLEATMRDVRGIDRETQGKMISKYINASPADRPRVLMEIEADAIVTLAARYGVDSEVAKGMYMKYATDRGTAVVQAEGRRFSNAKIEDPNNPGVMIYADEFTDAGEIGTISPLFASQLKGNHVLMDFNVMDKILRINGSTFGKSRNAARRIPGAANAQLDVLNRYWKAGQLLSVRYGIRAISDDLMSQTARYGTIAMLSRSSEGVKNLSNRVARGTWQRDVAEADHVQIHLARQELKDADTEIARLTEKVATDPSQLNRMALENAKMWSDDILVGIAEIERGMAIRAADKPLIRNYGRGQVVIEPAYGGTTDGLYRSLVSNSRGWDNLMGASAGQQYKKLSTGDFRTVRLAEDEAGHMQAWNRILTRQFANDPLARQILAGRSESQLRTWLARDPEGRRHFKSLHANNMGHDDLIERAMADIEHVLPPTMIGRDAIAEAIVAGTKLPASALSSIPKMLRPQELRMEMQNTMVGTNALTASIDNAIEGFYRFANQLPAEKLSRSPLFAAQYSAHVDDLIKSYQATGVTHMTPLMRKDIARLARERSLADVKRFSFNMDFESRLAHAVRFVSPFFGATLESWGRWARVIGDRPSTIPHAGMLFSSPTRAGWTTDMNGNRIDPDGYVTDPETGERRLVPKNERNIQVQMPQWAVKGMEKATGLAIPEYTMPLDSMNVVLQGDPVWNPGFGPFVQIPLDKFADLSPTTEESFREMGLLPYNNRGILGGAAWMKEAYNAVTGTGMDQDMISVLRQQQYDYDNGKRSKLPSVTEAKANARKMSGLKMIQKFFLPMTVANQRGVKVEDQKTGEVNWEPIKMFVDEYGKMLRLDPRGAQDKFLDKYGESFFAFTTAMSKTNSSVPATTGGAQVEMKYKNLLETVDPDLGGLIAGPEGAGPYSAGAYYYQLDHETKEGSGVMKREKLTPQQWIDENTRKQGWRQYRQAMLVAQSKLFEAGFQTFEDKGAEEFRAFKKAVTNVLSKPKLVKDGQLVENKFYNKQWEEDFNSQDRGFYERRINEMRTVVDYFDVADIVTTDNPSGDGKILLRSDIKGLKEYIANRDAVQVMLADRESQDINAKSNGDIRDAFVLSTMDIMERYIPFAELHSRYLARDMEIDVYTRGD